MVSLDGKVAVVTGALTGIGRATALAFAEAGAKVVLCGRNDDAGRRMERKWRAAGRDVMYVHADLMHAESPGRIANMAAEAYGAIDILVHSAAMICHKPVSQVTQEDWDRLLQVNVKAAFFLVQAALPHLARTRGCVIFISSINAWNNAADNLVYDCSKAALNHMARGLARDLRPLGIRVNAVMPGGTRTPLLDKWLERAISDPKRRAEEKEGASLADPEQIADAVLLLASDKASWINGAAIPADGGFHIG